MDTLYEELYTLMMSRSFLYRILNVSDKNYEENHKTFACSIFFLKIMRFVR